MFRSERDAALGERTLETDEPIAARCETERVLELVAHERQAAVAEVQEVASRELAAGDIVAHHPGQDV